MAFLSIFFGGTQSLIDKFKARPSQPQNDSGGNFSSAQQ